MLLDIEEPLSLPLDGFDPESEDELIKRMEAEKELIEEMETEELWLDEMEVVEEEPELAKETSKPQESASSTRHSTPIYQMLERIENKVQSIMSISTNIISILDQS